MILWIKNNLAAGFVPAGIDKTQWVVYSCKLRNFDMAERKKLERTLRIQRWAINCSTVLIVRPLLQSPVEILVI